jgi:hypothetical protein
VILATGLLLLSGSLHAADLETMQASVVKTTSMHGIDRIWFGSGFLFRNDGKHYVVTSDHVILHGNESIQHSAMTENSPEIPLKYLVSDWGYGLALLEVVEKDLSDEALPVVTDLAPEKVNVGTPVVACGFPSKSHSLICDTEGAVGKLESEMQPHALVPALIELTGTHGEFGMSGGPVFTDSGAFVGMLSHQYLSGESTAPQNHLLVIPASTVFSWLSRYFSNPADFAIYFYNDEFMQVNEPNTFYSGELYFWYTREPFLSHGIVTLTLSNPNPSRFIESPHAQVSLQRILDGLRRPGVNLAKVVGFSGERTFRFNSFAEFVQLLQTPGLQPLVDFR